MGIWIVGVGVGLLVLGEFSDGTGRGGFCSVFLFCPFLVLTVVSLCCVSAGCVATGQDSKFVSTA